MSDHNTSHHPPAQPNIGAKYDGWLIRVGGSYYSTIHNDGTRFRVTSVHGDTVYFVRVIDGLRQMDFSASLFRSSALPEDQSPIPELLAACWRAIELINAPRNEGVFEARSVLASAIAKAGVR